LSGNAADIDEYLLHPTEVVTPRPALVVSSPSVLQSSHEQPALQQRRLPDRLPLNDPIVTIGLQQPGIQQLAFTQPEQPRQQSYGTTNNLFNQASSLRPQVSAQPVFSQQPPQQPPQQRQFTSSQDIPNSTPIFPRVATANSSSPVAGPAAQSSAPTFGAIRPTTQQTRQIFTPVTQSVQRTFTPVSNGQPTLSTRGDEQRFTWDTTGFDGLEQDQRQPSTIAPTASLAVTTAGQQPSTPLPDLPTKRANVFVPIATSSLAAQQTTTSLQFLQTTIRTQQQQSVSARNDNQQGSTRFTTTPFNDRLEQTTFTWTSPLITHQQQRNSQFTTPQSAVEQSFTSPASTDNNAASGVPVEPRQQPVDEQRPVPVIVITQVSAVRCNRSS
jgi:hypothetical protein